MFLWMDIQFTLSIQILLLVGMPCILEITWIIIVREDLNALENEFETIWVEIKNKKSQNVLCFCAYRHPNTEVEKFNSYTDKVMQKISKENKLIFVWVILM